MLALVVVTIITTITFGFSVSYLRDSPSRVDLHVSFWPFPSLDLDGGGPCRCASLTTTASGGGGGSPPSGEKDPLGCHPRKIQTSAWFEPPQF